MPPEPLRFMRLDQIDGNVWTVPGEGTKGRKDATPDFRVPLSTEAQILIEKWRCHYNTVRPHSALGCRPPAPETIVPMDPMPTML